MEDNKKNNPQVKPLFRSEEFWKRPKEQITKEVIERQMKARAYEEECCHKERLKHIAYPMHKSIVVTN